MYLRRVLPDIDSCIRVDMTVPSIETSSARNTTHSPLRRYDDAYVQLRTIHELEDLRDRFAVMVNRLKESMLQTREEIDQLQVSYRKLQTENEELRKSKCSLEESLISSTDIHQREIESRKDEVAALRKEIADLTGKSEAASAELAAIERAGSLMGKKKKTTTFFSRT